MTSIPQLPCCTNCWHVPDKLQQLLLDLIPSSPVPELLRNLHLPSKTQVSEIQNTIAKGKQNIESVDAMVLQMQSILDQLHQGRSAIDRYVKEHQAIIMSPIRRLPNELLGEIFAIYTDDNREDPRSPWLLTQVCAGWRDVAVATPEVWSTIDLKLPASISNAYITMVTTWVARSRDHPLTFKISAFREPDRGSYEPIAEIFAACSDRWKHVELDMHFKIDQLPNTEFSLSSLQSIAVSGLPAERNVYNFQRAHNLRCLRLNYGLTMDSIKLKWDQLTEIHLYSIEASESLRILERCPNLAYVAFAGNMRFDDGARENLSPRVSLHSTITLVVSTRTYAIEDISFIDHLILPNLRDLTLHAGQGLEAEISAKVTALVHRSKCTLDRLLFLDVTRLERIEDCLQNIPSLTELVLRGYCILGEFDFKPFTIKEGQGQASVSVPILPNLRVLRLQRFISDQFGFGSFLDMIESRWSAVGNPRADIPVACLQKVQVTVHLEENLATEVLERMKKLQAKGMDLSVQSWDNKKIIV